MDQAGSQFLQILAEDVQCALGRMALSDAQPDRRNLLRTIVSAAEGVSWFYRMQVLAIAKDLDAATPQIEMAFAEASYAVSSKGEIIEQVRYISLTAMIRLVTKVAISFCPRLEVDFGNVGWEKLKVAIEARNRVTHPKVETDLTVSDEEIEAAKIGFFWFLDMTENVMLHILTELALHASIAKRLLAELKAGDPETLALYEQVHREIDS